MTVAMRPIHRPGSPESAHDESQYAAFAAAQFRILKDYMAQAKLNTYSRVVTLANGVVITCKKSFNREDIYISVPVVPVVTEKVVKVFMGVFAFDIYTGAITAPFSLGSIYFVQSRLDEGVSTSAYVCSENAINGYASIPPATRVYYTHNQNWLGDGKTLAYKGSTSRYGLIVNADSAISSAFTVTYSMDRMVLGCAEVTVPKDVIVDGVSVTRDFVYILYAFPYESVNGFGTRTCGFGLACRDVLDGTEWVLMGSVEAVITREYDYPSVFFSASGMKCCSVLGDKVVTIVIDAPVDGLLQSYVTTETPATTDFVFNVSYRRVLAMDYIGETPVQRVANWAKGVEELGYTYGLGATEGDHVTGTLRTYSTLTSSVIGGLWDAVVTSTNDRLVARSGTVGAFQNGSVEDGLEHLAQYLSTDTLVEENTFIAYEDMRHGVLVLFTSNRSTAVITENTQATYSTDTQYAGQGIIIGNWYIPEHFTTTAQMPDYYTYTKAAYKNGSAYFSVSTGPTEDDDFNNYASPYFHLFTTQADYSTGTNYMWQESNVHAATHPEHGTILSVIVDINDVRLFVPEGFEYLADASTDDAKRPFLEQLQPDGAYTLRENITLRNISIAI